MGAGAGRGGALGRKARVNLPVLLARPRQGPTQKTRPAEVPLGEPAGQNPWVVISHDAGKDSGDLR